MPRKEGQKLKLMTLLEILRQETDENHPLSVPQLLEMLEARGIEAERKSIYDDIDTLNSIPDAKFSIEQRRGRGGGYYITESPFELAELKLLIDAVCASRFITQRKSKRLIEKLTGFTSRYRQEELNRKVLVGGRIKSTEEQILYTVNDLHSAITAGEQVQFKYRQWTLDKRLLPRHEGKVYRVSPWALVWENGNYYMIAYTNGEIRNYRVDKIAAIKQLEGVPREGAEAYAAFDVNTYTQQIFSMYGGPVKKVTLRCENSLVGPILDRFGTGPILVKEPDGAHFTIMVEVQESPQFYGWLFGLGKGVEILWPDEVRGKFCEMLAEVQANYAGSSPK